MSLDPVEILKVLVAIPSVNPMGRDVTGPEYYETRLSDYLEQFFDRLKVDYERIEVLEGRHNVVALWNCPGSNSTILLDAHQDTVPVDGMIIDPFHPKIENGRLYGRGACDVKGGLAAMLAAFARLVTERPSGAANVIMSCTCDEEATAKGIKDLASLWTDPARSGSLISAPPTVAVIAEPTDLDIVVAHRGAVRWKLRTTGRACHSSRPEEGVNAIYKMSRIVTCLEAFAQELRDKVPAHPRCGSPSFSVGRISGGISVNTVPDECTIEIDRRCIPGENPADVIPAVTRFLQERTDVDFEMLPPWTDGLTLADDNNGELAAQLMRHITAVDGPHKLVGVPYGTHASRTSAAGVPSVVFGPGSIAQAHTVDEWIDIEELRKASEIYFRFCAQQ